MFNDASPDVEADGQSGYQRHSPLSAAAPEVVKAVETGRLLAHLKLELFKSELWEICGKPLFRKLLDSFTWRRAPNACY
jgi:hypothetical protein